MNFFDKLFGKKETKAVDPKPEKKQNNFLTNSHTFGLGEIELGVSGAVRIDGILAIAALDKIAKERNQEFKFGVMHTTLLEEGALTVPVVCSIGTDKYSIFFIYQEDDLLKYRDLLKYISQTAYPNLIYFSSIRVVTGHKTKPCIEPFQLADLRVDKGKEVAGRFAMWWSAEDDPYFHQSKTYEYLSTLNKSMHGYETYMLGYVLRQTRVVQEQEIRRMRLPEQNISYIIDAPEEKKVILDISQEKGIQFLFPVGKVTREYRERFLKGVMVDFVANIISLKQHKFPVDEKVEPNSLSWFEFMSKMVREKEEAGELSGHHVGAIEFNTSMN